MHIHREPIRPTSWQLQEHGRAFPPNYLHVSWRDYLYWDVELRALIGDLSARVNHFSASTGMAMRHCHASSRTSRRAARAHRRARTSLSRRACAAPRRTAAIGSRPPTAVQAAVAELYRLAGRPRPGRTATARHFSGAELVAIMRGDVGPARHSGAADRRAVATIRRRSSALRDGADGVIKKPFHFEVLVARIDRELSASATVEELRSDNRALDARVVERAIELGELQRPAGRRAKPSAPACRLVAATARAIKSRTAGADVVAVQRQRDIGDDEARPCRRNRGARASTLSAWNGCVPISLAIASVSWISPPAPRLAVARARPSPRAGGCSGRSPPSRDGASSGAGFSTRPRTSVSAPSRRPGVTMP